MLDSINLTIQCKNNLLYNLHEIDLLSQTNSQPCIMDNEEIIDFQK